MLMEFDLRESSQGSVHVVSVLGDVDISTAPQLDACIQRRISAGKREIALDLESCSYLDSEGIKVLIKALRALSGQGRVLICGARGAVRRVLEISGLDGLFEMLPSVEDLLRRSALLWIALVGCSALMSGCSCMG
jgi:anti-anti-sigma factor